MREAVVTGRETEGKDRQLVAYIVPEKAGKRLTNDELREQLAKKLQPALIPSAFVRLDSLPLTGSGKVDRKALPLPAKERQEVGDIEDILSMLENFSEEETKAMLEELENTK